MLAQNNQIVKNIKVIYKDFLNKSIYLFVSSLLVINYNLFAQEYRNTEVDPIKYLPTLTFQEGSLLRTAEKNFPIAIDFNKKQDANKDGKVDVEDNIENMVLYAIGKSIKGVGRTGLEKRGPNNQCPTVYFNYAETYSHNVYQYWYYYGENSHLENHEHDWESVFIFERDTLPLIVQLTSFGKLKNYAWTDFQQDDGHIVLGVRRGDHSFNNIPKNGVAIRWNGEISAQEGLLYEGHGKKIPWTIYASNPVVLNAKKLDETIATKFYYGDVAYPRSGGELDMVRKAPWRRRRWRRPRKKDK